MSEAKLDLIAHIVSGLCASLDFVQPYYGSDGTHFGQCKYCKVVGFIDHSAIRYLHAPDCLVDLADRLRRGLLQEERQSLEESCPTPQEGRHSGRLGEDVYVKIRDQFHDVCIRNDTGILALEAEEMLSLLDWLEQNRAELKQLAK